MAYLDRVMPSSAEAQLCLLAGYFMLEYGDNDITGWGERWGPHHRIEPFVDAEYIWGSPTRALWEAVWDEEWTEALNDPGHVHFDYLYFGM